MTSTIHTPSLTPPTLLQHPLPLTSPLPVVVVVVVNKLLVICFRNSHPLLRHNTRKSDSHARGSIQPPRSSPASQLKAQLAGEMIAVLTQQIVLAPHEFRRRVLHDRVDFCWGEKRDAVQYAAAERCSGGCSERRRVVDACFVRLRVTAVSIFNWVLVGD